MAQIKIGLIGCGGISRAHARGYQTLTDIFKVTATCDVNEAAAKERAEELGTEKVFTDYRRLLDEEDVDAVDICLPHHLHCEVAVVACQAGKHVLVEKPIANTLEEADAMIKAAKKAGVVLMVAHNQRYMPQHQKAKQLIEQGVIGKVFLARVDHNQNVRRQDWLRFKEQAGGGVIIGSGIHRIDILRWLVGEVRRVSNFQVELPELGWTGGCEAAGVTIFEFDNGAIGEMVSNWAVVQRNRWGAPWGEMFWIYGTEGSIHNVGGSLFLNSTQKPECEEGYIQIELEQKDSFTEEIRHFGQCILEGKEPLTSGVEARKSLEVALAAYRAAETGKVVKLPLRRARQQAQKT